MSQSTRTMPLMTLTAAALFSGVAGAETRTTTVKAATTKTVVAKHAAVARPAAAVAPGRMVSTKTSTGKSVTYNCSKAGNANKKACK